MRLIPLKLIALAACLLALNACTEEFDPLAIRLYQPSDGQQVVAGKPFTARWQGSTGAQGERVSIDYRVDGGNWISLLAFGDNDGEEQLVFEPDLINEDVYPFTAELRLNIGGIDADQLITIEVVSDAGLLPLLPAGQHAAIVYSTPKPSAKATLDNAFGQSFTAGAKAYELYFRWSEVEATPHMPDYSDFDARVGTLKSAGYIPYVVIGTIDTNTLQVPSDFRSTDNANQFQGQKSFAAPELRTRFTNLLEYMVPRLVDAGCFYISVGNEVDVWLEANPGHADDFVEFVRIMRDFVRGIDPRMAIGATLTDKVGDHQWVDDLIEVCDAVSMTYYLTDDAGSVRDPANVNQHINAMLARVPGHKQVLLQEVGCPSGYETPTNGSSTEIQRQFIENVFTAVAATPRIRFINVQHLADWRDEEITEFQSYYGSNDPGFVEFLSTLGLHWNDGVAKPAFQAYLDGVADLQR